MNTYDKGDSVRVKADFTDVTGSTPVDPNTITCEIKDPANVTTTYTFGASAIIKEAIGVYHLDFTVNQVGYWSYRWAGVGGYTAKEWQKFYVSPDPF